MADDRLVSAAQHGRHQAAVGRQVGPSDRVHATAKGVKASCRQPVFDRSAPIPTFQKLGSGDDAMLASR